MRRWWAELQRAQERHVARYDVSGGEARAALERRTAGAPLRWDGSRLVGRVLPDGVPGATPDAP